MREPKICKCGHFIESHIRKRKLNQKLKLTGFCESCPCTNYLNRKRPDKSDKISAICFGLMGGMMLFGAVGLFWFAQDSTSDISTIYILMGGIMLIIFADNILPSSLEYFIMKKRKTWPVSENT